jgi:hypothetical protein
MKKEFYLPYLLLLSPLQCQAFKGQLNICWLNSGYNLILPSLMRTQKIFGLCDKGKTVKAEEGHQVLPALREAFVRLLFPHVSGKLSS